MPLDKLEVLAAAAQFDVCGYSGRHQSNGSPLRFIYRSTLPNGGSVCLFKVLLTNSCVNDCAYCVNQVGRDVPRNAFEPAELARLFMELYRKRMVHGLFLSSSIHGNAVRTQERLIDTVEILRNHYEFKGYVHLKIMPGATFDCVEAACKLANRVSINMEAPTVKHLAKLSSKKNLYDQILRPMKWVRQITAANELVVPSGQTTQFVVGAAGETDRDILHTVEGLYSEVKLRRAYFSAFSPIRHSRLESHAATPSIREHRLYQADWLLRVYGFAPSELELALGSAGNLPLTKDPKTMMAQKQPWLFPVDVNKASYAELLRVPGIGPVAANRIVEARGDHSIDSLAQLKKMRVVTKWATPYIWFRSMLMSERQTSFMPQLLEEEEAPPTPSLAEAIGQLSRH